MQVFDVPTLDAVLRGKWAAFHDALRRGDTAASAAAFLVSARDSYLDELDALASAGALTQVGIELASFGLNLVRVRDKAVEYELRVLQDGVEYSHYVLFAIDEDGVRRLAAF